MARSTARDSDRLDVCSRRRAARARHVAALVAALGPCGCAGASTAGGGEPAAREGFEGRAAASASTAEPLAQPEGVGLFDIRYVEAASAGPPGIPPFRKQGDLTVEHPPRRRSSRAVRSRMRSHVDGSLQRGSPRTWVGPPVPAFVPLALGPVELTLLDPVRTGPREKSLAFYREPYGGTCTLGARTNCRFAAVLFDDAGKVLWSLPVSNLLSRPDHLDVQDVVFDGATLFVNEACQASAQDAGGKCSSLVAIEPPSQKVLWRSAPLVSRGPFVLAGRYLVTSYGHYNEASAVYVVRKTDGKVMHKRALPGMPEWLELESPGVVRVEHREPSWSANAGARTTLTLELRGFDGESPSLTQRPSPTR